MRDYTNRRPSRLSRWESRSFQAPAEGCVCFVRALDCVQSLRMRVLVGFGLSLAAVALWPRSALATPPEERPPAGRLQPSPQDTPWGVPPPKPVEAPTEQDPDASQPQDSGEDNPPSDQPDAPNGDTDETPRPNVSEPEVADPGDARPDSDVEHERLLEVEKKLGPKQIEVSAAVYGMVVTNVVYLTGTVGPTGESPVFAVPGSTIDDGLATDGQFLITARQSRFGLQGSVQITPRVDIKGMIEVDFFGLHENEGPTSVLQPGLRLRLGKLDVGDARFRFIAGQDWSVVTPRLPTSLSHMVVAPHTFAGAVWGRLPQITFAFRQPVGKADSALGEPKFTLQISVARNFSGEGFGGGITRFDKPDPGTLGRLPVGQMRVAFDSKVFSLGAGGHIGRENHQVARLDADGNLTTIDDHVPTWMVTGDLKLASKWVWFAGQGYYGHNINGMLSNQGVRFDRWSADEIDPADPRVGQPRDVVDLPGAGGWVELGASLGTEKVKLVASGGADVGDRQLVAVGSRWLNTGMLAALIYAPISQFDMSLEYQRIMSFYRGASDDSPLRETRGNNDFVAASFRFKF